LQNLRTTASIEHTRAFGHSCLELQSQFRDLQSDTVMMSSGH